MVSTSTLAAADATVRGSRGAVFGPLSAASTAPLTLVHGSRGSGRTSFLLASSGRMRLSGGDIFVQGLSARSKARRLRAITGIAGFEAIDALEPAASLGEAIRERITWTSAWYKRVPKPSEAYVRAVLTPAFGPLEQPASSTLVRDLSERDDLLVRIAMALTGRPQVLLIDDLDGVKDPIERSQVASRIQALVDNGFAFIVGSTDHRDLELFDPSRVAVINLADAKN